VTQRITARRVVNCYTLESREMPVIPVRTLLSQSLSDTLEVLFIELLNPLSQVSSSGFILFFFPLNAFLTYPLQNAVTVTKE